MPRLIEQSAETDLRRDRKSEILCARFTEFVERDTRSSFVTPRCQGSEILQT
jgi:hypothetical protein